MSATSPGADTHSTVRADLGKLGTELIVRRDQIPGAASRIAWVLRVRSQGPASE